MEITRITIDVSETSLLSLLVILFSIEQEFLGIEK